MGLKSLWRKPPQRYKHLLVRAAPGLHDAAIRLLTKHVSPNGRGVVDLASGTGAWLLRLRDKGYTDQTAVELDRNGFGLDGLEPLPINLNAPFAKGFDSRYGIVTAIEIMEHLDCPRHFLREIHSLLDDGGYLLLSTPNLGHWAGRIRFLFSGEHRYFKPSDYHHQRHISPVTHEHIKLMFAEVGFELVGSDTGGSFFGPIKRLLVSPVSMAFRLVFGPRTQGDAVIYLARKVNRSIDSKGSTSFYFKDKAESSDSVA